MSAFARALGTTLNQAQALRFPGPLNTENPGCKSNTQGLDYFWFTFSLRVQDFGDTFFMEMVLN